MRLRRLSRCFVSAAALVANVMLPTSGLLGAPASPSAKPYPERLQWWADGRFGLFIHWGPVSLKGTEISWSRANSNPECPNHGTIPVEEYDNLYKRFNPTNFDAAQWAEVAKSAGARYVVLTAKHCDGFLLWRSAVDDYNIGQTPFRRDVCAELAEATRRAGLRIGWYFSPMDWRDPDFRTEQNSRFLGRMQGEVRELLSRYGAISLLWFDWDGRQPLYDQARTYALVKELQPNIVIDNRLDLGKGDSNRKLLSTNADYYTPEQQLGAYDDQTPWETCMTLGTQWSWKPNDPIKSLAECLRILTTCAGGDGNLLLNTGPMPDGRIEPRQAERLREIGAWLAANGESIYGTRGGPFKPGSYGVSTRRHNTVYLHITDWVEDTLKLPDIPARVLRSRVLGGGKPVVRQHGGALEVSVEENDRQPIDTIVALELDSDASRLAAVDVPEPLSLATRAKATASNVYHNQAAYGADKAVDGNKETRWAADAGVHQAWLELDLGKPATFRRARILEAFPNRVQQFELQRLDGDEWKTFFTGTTLGEAWKARFDPVTARRVRLTILQATDGPTIWEFQLGN